GVGCDLRFLGDPEAVSGEIVIDEIEGAIKPSTVVLSPTLTYFNFQSVSDSAGECVVPWLLENSNIRELSRLEHLDLSGLYDRPPPQVDVSLFECFPKLKVFGSMRIEVMRDGVEVRPPFPEAPPGLKIRGTYDMFPIGTVYDDDD